MWVMGNWSGPELCGSGRVLRATRFLGHAHCFCCPCCWLYLRDCHFSVSLALMMRRTVTVVTDPSLGCNVYFFEQQRTNPWTSKLFSFCYFLLSFSSSLTQLSQPFTSFLDVKNVKEAGSRHGFFQVINSMRLFLIMLCYFNLNSESFPY